LIVFGLLNDKLSISSPNFRDGRLFLGLLNDKMLISSPKSSGL
jgi:hypothetical protein